MMFKHEIHANASFLSLSSRLISAIEKKGRLIVVIAGYRFFMNCWLCVGPKSTKIAIAKESGCRNLEIVAARFKTDDVLVKWMAVCRK